MNTTNEDDTYLALRRRIRDRKEMNSLSRKLFPVGASMIELEEWLIAEGWSLEEWKQTERDRKKGLL